MACDFAAVEPVVEPLVEAVEHRLGEMMHVNVQPLAWRGMGGCRLVYWLFHGSAVLLIVVDFVVDFLKPEDDALQAFVDGVGFEVEVFGDFVPFVALEVMGYEALVVGVEEADEFLQGFGDLGMAVVVGKVFGQRVAHGDEVDGGVASEVVKHVACAEGYPLPFFVEGGVGAKAVDASPEHQRHFLHQVAAAFAVAVAVFPADGPDDFLVSADECGVGFV